MRADGDSARLREPDGPSHDGWVARVSAGGNTHRRDRPHQCDVLADRFAKVSVQVDAHVSAIGYSFRLSAVLRRSQLAGT